MGESERKIHKCECETRLAGEHHHHHHHHHHMPYSPGHVTNEVTLKSFSAFIQRWQSLVKMLLNE